MVEIKKISDYEWEIPITNGMNVPGRIFASEKIFDKIEENSLKQVKNVAKLPGIIRYSIAMPDIHQGYGFPIGGVAAFDIEKGIISPGGVGYDINCGVRLLITDINADDFMDKRREILKQVAKKIPSGVGKGYKEKISKQDLKEVLELGSEWALKKGYAHPEDLEHTEEGGRIKGADPSCVSERAIARGLSQLGTLGAGNHFIDLQKVSKIFDKDIAERFNIKENSVAVMIHCGSRGLGHQIASDYIKEMENEYSYDNLPDRELIYAPVNSPLGKKYLAAMNCAVNFAFCNRQIIMHKIREILKKYFPENKISLLYDVAHNIAKVEEHFVEGILRKVCVHRKGATRCFGPGRKEIPFSYRDVGQPVIIPGSMGTASYVLVGSKRAEEISFGSTAHGSGRTQSRAQAHRTIRFSDVKKALEKKDIFLETRNTKGIVEEAPLNYKDSSEVVDTCHNLGLGRKVAKLFPIGVVIG